MACPAVSKLELSMMSSSLTDFNELCKRIQNNLFKVLVVGDAGVGKTSIIKQAALRCFSPHYRATIGVDFVSKRVRYKETVLKMQLWDVAGQERCGSMTRVYYKDAVAAFVVFDVTRPETFDSVLRWKGDIDDKVLLSDGSFIPCVLLANKCDEPEKKGMVRTPERLDEFCEKNGFLGWYETSAKEDIGISDALYRLSGEIVNNVRDMFPYIEPGQVEEEKLRIAKDFVAGRRRRECNNCAAK